MRASIRSTAAGLPRLLLAAISACVLLLPVAHLQAQHPQQVRSDGFRQ